MRRRTSPDAMLYTLSLGDLQDMSSVLPNWPCRPAGPATTGSPGAAVPFESRQLASNLSLIIRTAKGFATNES